MAVEWETGPCLPRSVSPLRQALPCPPRMLFSPWPAICLPAMGCAGRKGRVVVLPVCRLLQGFRRPLSIERAQEKTACPEEIAVMLTR